MGGVGLESESEMSHKVIDSPKPLHGSVTVLKTSDVGLKKQFVYWIHSSLTRCDASSGPPTHWLVGW